MRKGIKKAISALLVAVMLFSIAPLSGFVGLELPSFAEIFNKKADGQMPIGFSYYRGACLIFA